MELAKFLLKIAYLTLIYISVYVVVKPQVQIRGLTLNVVVLGIAVVIMYFTFEQVYDFLVSSEIIFKKDKKDKKDKKNKKNKKNKSSTEFENTVHIDNSSHSEQSKDFVYDHTHKFIKDKIFQ